jgi:hypothetical protein
MRSARFALMLALVAINAPAGLAERLDKRTCKTLKVELAGMLAVGVKDDMERGAAWAKANLSPEKLQKIRRLIEVEEQLEFRCGLTRQRVVAVSPAEGPGNKKGTPEQPEKKPAKAAVTEQSGIATEAEIPPRAAAAKGAEEKVVKKAPAKSPAKGAAGSQQPPKAQAAAVNKAERREASTYVSPRDVNPFSLSRFGTTR